MRILILTDSNGNPRGFPAADITKVEETYPQLIREAFPEAVVYQLSFGNITTEELLSQAIGYLSHWSPDVIIVHSGIADCRPEAFSEIQKYAIGKLSRGVLSGLKSNIYNPEWIRRRQIRRVSEASFRKTLKKFRRVFAKAKIYWVEIATAPGYEDVRPGVGEHMRNYNNIIREVYGDGFVPTQDRLLACGGFNADSLHLNKHGHEAIKALLLDRIGSESVGEGVAA